MLAMGSGRSEFAEQKRLCDPIRATQIGKYPVAYTIFPNQSISQGFKIGVSQTDIVKGLPSQAFAPSIVGCIDYASILRDRHHQTGFVYKVTRTKPQYPGLSFVMDTKEGDVPMDVLFLDPWGGSYAD
jgi:hypothetical protein